VNDAGRRGGNNRQQGRRGRVEPADNGEVVDNRERFEVRDAISDDGFAYLTRVAPDYQFARVVRRNTQQPHSHPFGCAPQVGGQ
jgi:hypothetical protein